MSLNLLWARGALNPKSWCVLASGIPNSGAQYSIESVWSFGLDFRWTRDHRITACGSLCGRVGPFIHYVGGESLNSGFESLTARRIRGGLSTYCVYSIDIYHRMYGLGDSLGVTSFSLVKSRGRSVEQLTLSSRSLGSSCLNFFLHLVYANAMRVQCEYNCGAQRVTKLERHRLVRKLFKRCSRCVNKLT